MTNLKSYRQKIGKIDAQIVTLLEERAKIAQKIGQAKKDKGLPIYDETREKKVLEAVINQTKELPKEGVEAIFQEIISLSRAIQTPIKVAYLGPEGTFTHEAAVKQFGKSASFLPVKTIPNIFEAVASGETDFGVVPIENSIEGPVRQTHELLIGGQLVIIGEIYLPIHHNLLTASLTKLNKITKIYSHPQALGQCQNFIQKNLPEVTTKDVNSTAEAAKIAKKEKRAAAIANKLSAQLYGLKILVAGIEDNPDNMTRFFVLGKNGERLDKKPDRRVAYKTSLLFTVKDRPGILRDCLACFADQGINLTRIISHPSGRRLWDFVFFIDLDGHLKGKKVTKALLELEKKCQLVKILGNYPKA